MFSLPVRASSEPACWRGSTVALFFPRGRFDGALSHFLVLGAAIEGDELSHSNSSSHSIAAPKTKKGDNGPPKRPREKKAQL